VRGSLYIRLTLAFLAILLALGASLMWLAQSGASQRSLEVTQRLNAPVARYMAETVAFADADGLRGEALAELAPHVMTINPSVQVYLLDAAGHVVAQAPSLNTIDRHQVDLGPVHRFLNADIEYPLLGDDPIADARRPFSTWPVERDGRTVGYVYAVLGSVPDDTLLQTLQASRSTRELATLIGGALLLAGLAGGTLFFTMTRRLRELTRRVESDREAMVGIDARDPAHARGTGPRDEIDELALAYETMSGRLHAQYSQLAASDAERRELVASVSHDLRTPLTTLFGYLETLELGEGTLGSDERRRCLEIAHRHARILRTRIDEQFELSRLSADGASVCAERFSLRELVDDCLQDFRPIADECDARLALDVASASAEGRFPIDADIGMVQRMLENLVDNALRHIDTGGTITISLRRADDRALHVEVRDDGCGMTPEIARRAFDSCFSGAADPRGRGGLGLSIVARIVALHGGSIKLASGEARGARFLIELPGPVDRCDGVSGTPSRPSTVRLNMPVDVLLDVP